MKKILTAFILVLAGCTDISVNMKQLQVISNCYCNGSDNVTLASYTENKEITVFCKDGRELRLREARLVNMGSCLEKQ